MLISNKSNKIIKILALLIILITIFSKAVFAIVNPTNDFYVNDYANLLDSGTKEYIINTNKKLYAQTGAQIVVVTVKNLEGDSLEEYATKLFRSFGIGDKTKNNGVLLLLALEERQFRIEVGYGLEGTLTDGKTGRIQDEYIIPYLKQNNWNDGIKNGFDAVLDVVKSEYGANFESDGAKVVGNSSDISSDSYSYMRTIFFIPVISLIVGMIIRALKKKQKISKTFTVILYTIYMICLGIIHIIMFQEVYIISFFLILNFGFLMGGSSRGRRRILWWRFFRRWIFFWRPEAHLEEEVLPEDGGSSRSF